MSGGHFDYNQDNIIDIGKSIEELINNNGKSVFDEEWEGYSEATIQEFKYAVEILRKAYVYSQRIDWLVCGDDGEETFHERLNKELRKAE